MPEDINNVSQYILKQIYDSNITPVLGAGISCNTISSKNNEEKPPHKMKNMIKKIKEALHLLTTDYNKDKDFLDRLSQKYYWKSSETKQENSYEDLVKLLDIEDFVYLSPTPAHRYLAILAREGLISDVITTNYDCCLERAYLSSWGLNDDEVNKLLRIVVPPMEIPDSNKPVARLYNRDTFTRHAARKTWTPMKEWGKIEKLGKTRVLKIHKINGCSASLLHEEKDYSPPYKSILLTETQLQDWRERQWAADLFRHKLRTTSLVFCGFGSDEPQILHTLEKVFEESEIDGNDSSQETRETSNLFEERVNIPIVTIYEPCPSFSHEYIARQYLKSIRDTPQTLKRWNELIIKATNYYKDIHPIKSSKTSDKKLPADILWKGIYLKIFHKLVKDSLNFAKDSAEASFTSILPHNKNIIKVALSEWDTLDNPSNLLKLLIGYDDIFTDETAFELPPLAKMITHLTCPKNLEEEKAYSTINDHKSLTAEIVTLIYMVLYKTNKTEKSFITFFESAPKRHIHMKIGERELSISVHSHRTSNSRQEKEILMSDSKHLELMVGLAGNTHKAIYYRRKIRADAPSKQVIQLSWKDIYYEEKYMFKDIDTTIDRVKDAIEKPSKYLARQRKGLKKNPRLGKGETPDARQK